LLDTAAREAGIPAIIYHVRKIAGLTTTAGVWPKQEWLPSLITSSKYLGKLPGSLGRAEAIDWIHVDLLGQIMVELATHPSQEHQAGATVYHATNPQNTT
jgi:thioester reductase-like protein